MSILLRLTCLMLALCAGPAMADPHAIYEEACGRCHSAHAGAFFAKRLNLFDDRVVSIASGRPLDRFLKQGHGGLVSADADALTVFAKMILSNDRLFKRKCRVCHDPAVDLARHELIVTDGRLQGRFTGREIHAFLLGHGRLSDAEAGRIADMLRWQVETAPD